MVHELPFMVTGISHIVSTLVHASYSRPTEFRIPLYAREGLHKARFSALHCDSHTSWSYNSQTIDGGEYYLTDTAAAAEVAPMPIVVDVDGDSMKAMSISLSDERRIGGRRDMH